MTIKVHELAKELNLSSKEVLDKLSSMGVDAKGHMSGLSDIDAISVRNILMRGKAGTETKIVKVAPKKTEAVEEPKVVVKAAAIKPPLTTEQRMQKQQMSREDRPATVKPPIGKPVISKELENRTKPPIGKPVPKDLESRIVPKDETERNIVELEAQRVEKLPLEAADKPEQTSVAPTVQKYENVRTQQDTNAPRPAGPRQEYRNDRPQGASPEQRSDRPQGARPDQRSDRPQGARPDQRSDRPQGARPDNRDDRPQGPRPGYSSDRPQGPRPDNRGDRPAGPRPGYSSDRPLGPRPDNRGDRPAGPRPGYSSDRPQGPRPDNRGDRPAGPRPGYSSDRPQGPRPGYSSDRPQGPRPGYSSDRPAGPRPGYSSDRPAGQRPGYSSDRPQGSRPGYNSDRPQGSRPGYNSDRPQGAQSAQRDGKPAASTLETKPFVKRDDKTSKNTNKDRDKFAKVDPNKKAKPVIKEKSLEKQVKAKKQKSKYVAPEPEINMEELPAGTRIINVPITVAGFCEQLEISTSPVIMQLMRLGIMANINQTIDEDTVMILAEELGVPVIIGNVAKEIVEEGIELFEDSEDDLKTRPPIITVMGHVDHGKTSLLDAIRKTNVTAQESGGITQHIGASEVSINGQKIVFLDTPGHEAFTAMRARGAHVTDIAVLVVAADDSVKPQTIESISHAKAAGVPVIVAINKVDKPAADIDKVKQDLSTHGILVEEWGGDTISVPVSAKSGEGIVTLLEMILLQAEVLELRANPGRLASGTVIEARLDKSKGPVATLLVLNGTLHAGMSVVAGTSSGKIRLMTNFKGDTIKKAGPATAVEILGLTDVPEAGDEFNAVKEDKMAREIAENRKIKLREEVFARNSSTTLEKLFSQIQEGEVKELNLIIKGDVMGSVGALVASLEKLRNENVRVKIIHTGVGTVTESDIMLAGTSGAVIIGFNVRPSTAITSMAEKEGIEIRAYRVIYDVINDVEAAMKGMLDPVFKEVLLGKVEIRETFKVPGVGTVGGAYVTDGKMVRNADVRLVRDGIVIHEGKISSLKRFKDDAKEVAQGFECGIGIENYNDIRELDVIECFKMEEVERK